MHKTWVGFRRFTTPTIRIIFVAVRCVGVLFKFLPTAVHLRIAFAVVLLRSALIM